MNTLLLFGNSYSHYSQRVSYLGCEQMSDLAGTTVTLFLFGDAHKSLYKESEGSVFILYAPKVGGPDTV